MRRPEAVLRVLTDKFAVGLFARPYVDDNPDNIVPAAVEGRKLSVTLAREVKTTDFTD